MRQPAGTLLSPSSEDRRRERPRIADLAAKVQTEQGEDTPKTPNTPGRRALYNNLNRSEELALKIDDVVKNTRPDGWRGMRTDVELKRELYRLELE
jgi:type I restriction enzyme, R subunit